MRSTKAAKAHSFVNLSVLPTLGRTFQPVRRKNFVTDIFLVVSLFQKIPVYIKKWCLTKGAKFSFSAAQFYCHSGQIISKRVPNTGRRANKWQQITIFLQAHFKGKQTNDRKKGIIFHKRLNFTNTNWHNIHGYFQ
jgi:hypothetical protein